MFPKSETTGFLRRLKIGISLGTSLKNEHSTPNLKNRGSLKCGDASAGLEDANGVPTPDQENPKTTLGAPQEAAQTTVGDAKSVKA